MPVQSKILPAGDWLPDLPAFGNPGITLARNVTPLTKDSYGPIPSLASVGFEPIADPVLGMFTFLDANDEEHIFIGTMKRLYHLQTGSQSFTDVSKRNANGDPINYNAYLTNPWSMTAFGSSIIATNGVDPPQIFQHDISYANIGTLAAPGTDYTVNDVLTLVGGIYSDQATITIDSIDDDGGIKTFHMTDRGIYLSHPGNPITMTGGTGTGATVSMTWGIRQNTQFFDLALNEAPIGRFIATVRNWVMFGNITTADATVIPQRVQWSAIGDPGTWPTPGTLEAAEVQSDFNDLNSAFGWVRGIASGLQSADAAILMDGGVYAVTFVGSPATFNFQIAQGAIGCRVSSSIIVNAGIVYYLGLDGFQAFNGTQALAIGNQKIDHWFFTDPDDGVDEGFITLTQGAVDTSGRLILWLYCGPDSGGSPNRMLVYNWAIDRWSFARVNAEWVSKGVSMGYSLDELDQFGTMETLRYSLDSPVWQGGAPRLYVIDSNNQVTTFSGQSMAARIETTEIQFTPGARTRITNSRPLVDGGTAEVAIGTRNRLVEDVVWTPLVAMNYLGECPQRIDARYLRARIDISPPLQIYEWLCADDQYDATLDSATAPDPTGFNESNTATDSLDAVVISAGRALTEAAFATDSPSASVAFGFGVVPMILEVANATDEIRISSGFEEALHATDSNSATITRGGAISEAASATDTVNTTFVRAVSLTEAASATDSVVGGIARIAALTEAATATDTPDGTIPADTSMAPPAGYSSGDLLGEDLFTTTNLDLTKWVPWEGWHGSVRIGGVSTGGTLPSPYSGNTMAPIIPSGGFKVNLTNGSTTATLTWTVGVANGLTNGEIYFINDKNISIIPTSYFQYTGASNSTSGSVSITLPYVAIATVSGRAANVSFSSNGASGIELAYKDPYPYCQSANPGGWGLETWSGLTNTSPTDVAGGIHLQGGGGVIQLRASASASNTHLALGWSTVSASIAAKTGGPLILPSTGGYVQVRAKAPESRYGAWPGIWMMPDNGSGNDNLEIDLQEGGYNYLGFDPRRTVAQAFHAATVTPSGLFDDQIVAGDIQVLSQNTDVFLDTDYHIYGVEVVPGTSIKTYFDGVLTGTWTDNVPNTVRYALILDNPFASLLQASFHTTYDPAHPGPFNFLVNNVQVYGL